MMIQSLRVRASLLIASCLIYQACLPSGSGSFPAPPPPPAAEVAGVPAVVIERWAEIDASFVEIPETERLNNVGTAWFAEGREPVAYFRTANALAPHTFTSSGRARIAMPGDVFANVEVTETYVDPELGPTWVWTGTLEGIENSSVTLTSDQLGVSGTIDGPNGRFSVQQIDGNLHVLVAEPAQGRPPEGPSLTPPDELGAGAPPTAADPTTSTAGDPQPACPPAQVDVLVVYTPGVEQYYGTRETVIRTVRAAERRTNAALDSSRVAHRIRVVDIASLPTESSGMVGSDLARLAAENDGKWDEVHGRRRQARADIVSLWVPRGNDYCGLAYRIVKPAEQGRWGFNTVAAMCEAAQGRYTFSHEIGHNFGMDHNRLGTVPPQVVADYAFGFRASDGGLLTLEALNCGDGQTCAEPVRRLRYSNPRVKIGTVPIGVEHHLDPVNSADNARVALWTMCFASRWGEQLD